MKQQLLTAAGTCILTLLVTLSFNALAGRFLEDKGRVTIARPIATSGEIFAEVSIENWGYKPIDGLILVIPASISTSTLVASFPISIEDVQGYAGSKDSKRIKFSGIPPNLSVRILIPVPSIKSTEDFALPNLSQLDLQSQLNDYAENPTHRIWYSALESSIAYALLTGLAAYFWGGWFNSRLEKDVKEREELKARFAGIEANLAESKTESVKMKEQYKKESGEMAARLMKYRVYLLSRLSDYSKELDFWRGTIRGILMSGGIGKDRVEETITSVTASLRTYGTQGWAQDSVHFESVLEAARMLTKPESAE